MPLEQIVSKQSPLAKQLKQRAYSHEELYSLGLNLISRNPTDFPIYQECKTSRLYLFKATEQGLGLVFDYAKRRND